MTVSEMEQSRQAYEVLAENAQTHRANNPLLFIPEYSETNIYHQLETTFVEAITEDDLDTLIAIADGFYDEDRSFHEDMVEPLKKDPERLREMATVLLEGEENIFLVTQHEDLKDIILASFALIVAMTEEGLGDHKDFIRKNNVLVSRTIGTYDVGEGEYAIPLIEFLRKVGNIHLTLPRSQRIIDAGISEETIRENSRKVSEKLAVDEEFGQAIAIAAPGQSDYSKYDDSNNIIMQLIQPVPESNARLITKAGYVLAEAIVMNGDSRCFIILGKRAINSIYDVDELMHDMARVRQEATGIETHYLPPARQYTPSK